MGYSCQWDNDSHTIIRAIMDDDWTWVDMLTAVQDTYAMIADVDQTVDVIVQGVTFHTPAGDIFGRLRQIRKGKPANMGVLVLVTPSRFLEIVSDIFHKVYQGSTTPLFFVDTLENARSLLEGLRVKKQSERS